MKTVFIKMETVMKNDLPMKGDLLEELFGEWLCAKLSIIPYLNSDVNLLLLASQDMLHLTTMWDQPIRVEAEFERLSSLDQTNFKDYLNGTRLTISLNDERFWHVLSEIGKEKKNPVILASRPYDCFDVVMKYWIKGSENPCYWFVDLKSARESNDSDSSTIFRAESCYNQSLAFFNSWRSHGSQYVEENNVHFSFVSSHAMTKGLGKLNQAMKNNSYQVTSVTVLNRPNVMKYLDPFSSLYKAMR